MNEHMQRLLDGILRIGFRADEKVENRYVRDADDCRFESTLEVVEFDPDCEHVTILACGTDGRYLDEDDEDDSVEKLALESRRVQSVVALGFDDLDAGRPTAPNGEEVSDRHYIWMTGPLEDSETVDKLLDILSDTD